MTPISHIGTHQNTFSISLENIEAIWYLLLNNSFQYLNNNNAFDTYFYNIQIRISTILKIEQQYLNTATRWALKIELGCRSNGGGFFLVLRAGTFPLITYVPL